MRLRTRFLLSWKDEAVKVKELESRLFEMFPRGDAEDWDHVGLSVGDPEAEVERVFVALDATVEDIRAAHEAGANVLLAHHPVYIKAPEAFVPEAGAYPQASAAIFTAARLGVSVLSFHTNLDRSREARFVIARRLGFDALSSLEYASDADAAGYGVLMETKRLSLRDLAEHAATEFSVEPRVWGDPEREVSRIAYMGGSLGHFGELARAANADAIICGEAGYHVCQDLALRGVGVILLGHDVSEYPFCAVLADACAEVGVSTDEIVVSRVRRPWWTYMKG